MSDQILSSKKVQLPCFRVKITHQQFLHFPQRLLESLRGGHQPHAFLAVHFQCSQHTLQSWILVNVVGCQNVAMLELVLVSAQLPQPSQSLLPNAGNALSDLVTTCQPERVPLLDRNLSLLLFAHLSEQGQRLSREPKLRDLAQRREQETPVSDPASRRSLQD